MIKNYVINYAQNRYYNVFYRNCDSKSDNYIRKKCTLILI